MKSRISLIFLAALMLSVTFLPAHSASNNDKRNDRRAGFANPSYALVKSRQLINEGRYREALSVLSPFVSEPVKYPDAVSDYISILIWDGRSDEAIAIYEKLPKAFPRTGYLLRNVARAYYDKKEYAASYLLYNAAHEQSPSDEESQKGMVLSLIQSGDPEKASELLNSFLLKNPNSVSLIDLKVNLLSSQGKYAEALELFRSITDKQGKGNEYAYMALYNFISSLPGDGRTSLSQELKKASQAGDRKASHEYILLLAGDRDFEAVVTAAESAETDIAQYPDYLLSWIAWAYFQTNDTEKAKQYYRKILTSTPDYTRAELGLAYCMAKEKQTEEAGGIIEKLLSKDPGNLEVMFGQAYVYEKAGMFMEAIKAYDRILKINAHNDTAGRLRLMALSDLGASSYALENAEKELPRDVTLHESIRGDLVADRINWKEFPAAIDMLKPMVEDRNNIRARYDYIVALAENEDMQEAVRVYEELVNEGVPVSVWLMEHVAGAYLYLEQPYKALELYDRVLEIGPSHNSRIGRFYVLQEIRDWENAKKALADLDRDAPAALWAGNTPEPNWDKMEIAQAKGWLLLHEDRLQEAEQYFMEMHEKAPADSSFRTGLSHTYLWRGWPRKALREFEITETIDPKEVKVKIGKAATLEELAYREQAREDSAALMKKYPKNKHVQALARKMELEEMRSVITDITFAGDDDGFQEISARVRLTQPVYLYTDVYGFGHWQRSSADDDTDDDLVTYFRRAGLGAEHIFNSDWKVIQEFSVNYNDGNDFGSFTSVIFTPDDYWSFGLSYDSFSTDVPIRARVFDIEADKTEADVTYRESEWRSYHLSLSHSRYSDDNTRYQGMLGYEQGLWVRNDWRERVFIDLYTSFNSLDEAEYFNPDNDLGISVTHMTEHTVKRLYRKAFVYRLYLSAGAYKQAGYGIQPAGSVRYEHDIELSDAHSILYGASVGSQAYDGESVTGYSLYLKWRLLF